MRVKEFWGLLRETLNEWLDAKAPRLGAALACYAVMSLAPLLVLVLAVAGLAFGAQAAAGEVAHEIEGTVGRPVAEALQGMLKEAKSPWSGAIASVIGIVVLLFGASGVFGELQDAMNTIWQVAPKPGRGLRGIIHDRFLSFTMILGICFLLLVSLVITAALAVVRRLYLDSWLPGGASLWQGVNAILDFGVITLLFALIFKVLPDAKVRWKDVWIGAATTALLFTVGKYLLGLYVSHGGVPSGYGAAGSLVLILLWVYYSSQILLFGATFTRVYAQHTGWGIKPAPDAVPLTALDRARQGIPNERDLQVAQAAQQKRTTL